MLGREADMNDPGTYHLKGPAEVWVDGVKRYDAVVQLTR